MQFLLNVQVFNVWLPKQEKEKMMGGKIKLALGFEISLKWLQPEEEGQEQWMEVKQLLLPTFVWSSVIRSRTSGRSTDPQYLDAWVLFCPPGFYTLCKVCYRNTAHCLPWSWGWGMDSCFSAKNWNWPKVTTVYHLSLSLEVSRLQWSPEFQNSYNRQILPMQVLFRWGDWFLVLPTQRSSQNPLRRVFTLLKVKRQGWLLQHEKRF